MDTPRALIFQRWSNIVPDTLLRFLLLRILVRAAPPILCNPLSLPPSLPPAHTPTLPPILHVSALVVSNLVLTGRKTQTTYYGTLTCICTRDFLDFSLIFRTVQNELLIALLSPFDYRKYATAKTKTASDRKLASDNKPGHICATSGAAAMLSSHKSFRLPLETGAGVRARRSGPRGRGPFRSTKQPSFPIQRHFNAPQDVCLINGRH